MNKDNTNIKAMLAIYIKEALEDMHKKIMELKVENEEIQKILDKRSKV